MIKDPECPNNQKAEYCVWWRIERNGREGHGTAITKEKAVLFSEIYRERNGATECTYWVGKHPTTGADV